VRIAGITANPDSAWVSQRRATRSGARAPRARAHAERWVESLRRECLDRLLILGRGQLERTVRVYAEHYNGCRDPRPRCTTLIDGRADKIDRSQRAIQAAPTDQARATGLEQSSRHPHACGKFG
jgi:hypothetical protein